MTVYMSQTSLNHHNQRHLFLQNQTLTNQKTPGLTSVYPLLHLQLHEHFPQNTRKDSPSRQRRRARRAASRKQQAEKAQVDEAEEAKSNDLVKFQKMCSIWLYAIFLMIKLRSENHDVLNIEVLQL